jgi:WD40 repeat protein
VASVAYCPDGKTLASGDGDGTIKLWDTLTRKELATIKLHTADVFSVAYSKDGKTLASGSGDTTVKLWDMPVVKKTNK